jgi:NAD(P)H-flavin reductase
MCSQLQGRTFCDCTNWKGVCIYQEYVNNRKRIKEQRKSFVSRLIEKQFLSENVMLLKFKTNSTLARELNQPGAYVFLRSTEEPAFFDTPMSVMTTDERTGTVTAAVQIRGVKTKALKKIKEELLVRGPYWNGLLGLKYIKGLRNSRALLVTRGIGQAPALPVARKLVAAGNEVEVVLDKGRGGVNFAEQHFRELGCEVVHRSVLQPGTLDVPEETLEYIKKKVLEEGVRLVYTGGSEKLHQGVGRLLASMGAGTFFACSNDARVCCGEGICGSCHTRLADGSRIKTCKTQLGPVDIYGGR